MDVDLYLIYYNLRCQNYRSIIDKVTWIQDHTKEITIGSSIKIKFLFWKACANGFLGLHQDAVNDLYLIRKSHRHVDYAILMAIIWFHRKAEYVDEDELQKLNCDLEVSLDCIHVDGALLAADFCFHVQDYMASSVCLELPSNGQSHFISEDADCEKRRIKMWLHGTNLFSSTNASPDHNASGRSIQEEELSLDLMMAYAKDFESSGNLNQSLEILGQIMAKEASFYPAMIEKSKIHQCLQQYNIANDLAMKCLRIVPNNIDVLQILLLNQYITCHTQSDRTMYLHQLEQNLNLIELPPTDLCLQIVRLFCQVCSDDDDETLGMMSNLISPIVQLNTEDVAARVEWAHLLRRLGKIEDALAEYQNIVLLNEDKVEVALGIVHCNIMHGNIHEAKDQLDFMSLSYDKDVKMSNLEWNVIEFYLAATHREIKTTFSFLLEHFYSNITLSSIHTNNMFNKTSYIDIGTLVEISKVYLARWPMGHLESNNDIIGMQTKDSWNTSTTALISVLNLAVQNYPSSVQLWIVLTKLYFQSNQIIEASAVIQSSLSIYRNSGILHLIHAQVQLQGRNDIIGAKQSLERTMSVDFELRCHPIFSLVKGSILLKDNSAIDANIMLKEIIVSQKAVFDGDVNIKYIFSLDDKLSYYLVFLKTLKELHEFSLMEEILIEAESKFSHVCKSFYILKLKSDVFQIQKDHQGAYQLWKSVQSTSPFFVAAQLEAAKISVKSEGTINLFIQLQEVMKTTETAQRRGVYMALGDVCKKADLYKDALKAYNIVIDQHIYDDGIVKKIGDLLLVSHQYQQAVNHYQTFANESGTTIELFLIFVKMGNMRGAQKIFDEGINNGLASDEKVEYEHSVIFFIISATLLYCQKHFEESYRYLTKGTKIHLSFRNKPWLSKALSMEKVTDLVSFFISFQLPTIIMTRKIASSKHDDDLNLCYLSMQLYGENEYTLFGTIQILFQHRRFDKCRSYCNKLLALNNSHEGTISILGRLYTTKADFEAAYTLYKNMFTKHAQCYFVSFHFLQLLHRMDKKEEMESVLVHLAKEHSNVASGDKGYEACLGLFHYLKGQPLLALEYFNEAKCDRFWREEACSKMIEIYLRLNDYFYWKSSSYLSNGTENVLHPLKLLLREYSTTCFNTNKVDTFKGYIKIVEKREDIAIDKFMNILANRENFVPALVGLARVYYQNGNRSKFHNTLKKVAKLDYDSEHWKEFEWGYLLLATTYFDRKKLDLALDLCKRCLYHNKSCLYAWEVMGLVMEEKQNYLESIQCFLRAKNLGVHQVQVRSTVKIDSLLAKLYLKTSQYSKSIDVCTRALQHFPDSPQITELLERNVACLRP